MAPPSTKKIVVLGGGYAGLAATASLDAKYDVVLVDRKSHFWHSIGAPRALVEPEFRHQCSWPYEKAMKRGRFVQGSVESVTKDAVVVNGETIAFDYLILATGSQVNAPGKIPEDEIDVPAFTEKAFSACSDALKRAKKIIMIGGGAIGTEMAGEIRTDFPDKEVTVVNSGPGLCSTFTDAPEKFHRKLKEKADKMSIKVIPNNRVVKPDTPNEYGFAEPTEPVELKDGTKLEADLVFFTVGHIKFNTDFLGENFSDALTQRGTVKVNDHLQVSGHENIFAAGDIVDTPHARLAAYCEHYIKTVVTNIQNIENGKALVPYQKNWPVNIAKGQGMGGASLGRKSGQGYVGNFVVGGFLVGKMKGPKMFAPDFKKKLMLVK
eukprot:GFYU01001749.1.p1 GENE.GFYU01001749.1~~GFYU01001749.1.p1  ORF type:complete len:379 (-),score=141.91 GFYU01001749.1:17-1153(-)